MDIGTALGGISAAFGLASSAGLNAYIPLLFVALAARFPAGDPSLTGFLQRVAIRSCTSPSPTIFWVAGGPSP